MCLVLQRIPLQEYNSGRVFCSCPRTEREVWCLRTSALRRYNGNCGTRQRSEKLRDFWETSPWVIQMINRGYCMMAWDTNFIFSCWKYLSLIRSLKFVSPSGNVMFCLCYRYWQNFHVKHSFFYSFSKHQSSAIKAVTYRKMPVTKMLWNSAKNYFNTIKVSHDYISPYFYWKLCCNIRNVKSNYLKVLLHNVYHRLVWVSIVVKSQGFFYE